MHRTAKLTLFGRRLLIERIELEGWPIAHAAAMTGVSRQTATKWVRRHRAEGLAGLEDRSSRPHRSPRRLAPEQVAATLAARHELGLGPHRLPPLVGSPRSTITDVLRRHGLSRLRDRNRPSGVPIRYVRERAGELLHIDVKKLGRIPDGGGHRIQVEAAAHRAPGAVMTMSTMRSTTPAAYSGESDQSVRSFRSPSVGGRGAADVRARVIP